MIVKVCTNFQHSLYPRSPAFSSKKPVFFIFFLPAGSFRLQKEPPHSLRQLLGKVYFSKRAEGRTYSGAFMLSTMLIFFSLWCITRLTSTLNRMVSRALYT